MNRYMVTICFLNSDNHFRVENSIVEEVDPVNAKASAWKRFVRKHPDCEFLSWRAVRK